MSLRTVSEAILIVLLLFKVSQFPDTLVRFGAEWRCDTWETCPKLDEDHVPSHAGYRVYVIVIAPVCRHLFTFYRRGVPVNFVFRLPVLSVNVNQTSVGLRRLRQVHVAAVAGRRSLTSGPVAAPPRA